ncbi:MAG: hypothetical protein QGF55_05960, partial [SAR324 cluster bacterium]|nr:hypothetical protein [SAR324 cluster bacterium]
MDVALKEGLSFSGNVVEHPNLYYEMALLCNKNGNIEQSLLYYSKTLELEPTMVAARYDRAEIYLVQERYEEAYVDLITVKDMHHWLIHLRLAEVAAY